LISQRLGVGVVEFDPLTAHQRKKITGLATGRLTRRMR
jgi:hypothetical protein